MKGIASLASLASLAAFAAVLTFGPAAGAQQPSQPLSAPTRPRPAESASGGVTRTADYSEQSVGGDQVVKFTGDELMTEGRGYFGNLIRPLPGVTRVGLIRPRLNFVSELLKSVENL
jgi:hypothetical protein